MKRQLSDGFRRVVLGAVILAAAAPLAAQGPRRAVSVGLGGGGTVPIGDFANDVKAGWNAGAYLQYEPDRNIWGVRGEASYHRAGYTDEFLADVGATPDDNLSNAILHVGGTALLTGAWRDRAVTPYLLGGLGLYRLTVSLDQGATSQNFSENGFGFNLGGGVRLGPNSGLYLEARFHQFSITPGTEDGTPAVKSTYQMIPVSVGSGSRRVDGWTGGSYARPVYPSTRLFRPPVSRTNSSTSRSNDAAALAVTAITSAW